MYTKLRSFALGLRLFSACALVAMLTSCGDTDASPDGRTSEESSKPVVIRTAFSCSAEQSIASLSLRLSSPGLEQGNALGLVVGEGSEIQLAPKTYTVDIDKVMMATLQGHQVSMPSSQFEVAPKTVQVTRDMKILNFRVSRLTGPCVATISISAASLGEANVAIDQKVGADFVRVRRLKLKHPLHIDGLWPGTYRIRLATPSDGQAAFQVLEGGFGSARTQVLVQVSEDRPAEATLRIPSAGTLEVDVVLEGLSKSKKKVGSISLLRRYEGYFAPLPLQLKTTLRKVSTPGGDVQRSTYSNVPDGSYRVLLRRTGFRVQHRDISISPGGRARCQFENYQTGLKLWFSWPGAIPTTEDYQDVIPFGFNRFDYEHAQDVHYDSFQPNARSFVVKGMRPGRYVALVRTVKMAQIVDVGAKDDGRHISIDLPKNLLRGGSRRVSVVVRRGGKPVTRLLVGIVPSLDGGSLRDGQWFRYKDHGRSATFTGVPTGKFDILIFDGAYAAKYGFDENPIRRQVVVEAKDIEVEVDI